MFIMKLVGIPLLIATYTFLCFGVICLAYLVKKLVHPLFVFRKLTGRVLFGRWLFTTILAAAGLLIGFWVVFSDFVSVSISGNSVVLGYCWPRPEIVLPANKSLEFELERFGNGRRVCVVITSGSQVYRSTTVRKAIGEQVMVLLKEGTRHANQ